MTLSIVIVSVFYVIAAYAQVAGFGFDMSVLLDPAIAAGPLFALGSPPASMARTSCSTYSSWSSCWT